MAYWTFDQNNSGGSFDFDKERGITHHVIVEAPTRRVAIARAEDIGIYFNGCERGVDCSCCGDRWSKPWGEHGKDVPEVYGRNVRDPEDKPEWSTYGWMEDGFETCVHPLEGPLEWYGV